MVEIFTVNCIQDKIKAILTLDIYQNSAKHWIVVTIAALITNRIKLLTIKENKIMSIYS